MGPILDAFERCVRDGRHRPAIWSRSEGLRLDFAALSEEAESWERRLALPQGDPVAVATGNRAAFPALFVALLRSGVPFVSMDAGADLETRLETCRQLGISTLLHVGDAGEPVAADLRRVRVAGAAEPVLPPGTVLVKLTSGSTGEPLAACYDEEALYRGILQIAEGMEITADDRVLVAIPLSHSYGFDNGVLSLAVLGTPLVLASNIFPRPLLALLQQAEIRFFPTVPPLIRSLAESEAPWPEDLPLRTVICAGAPLRPNDAADFRARTGLAVHQFYGCTECGGIAYERVPEDGPSLGTVGHPLPGVRIELAEDGEVVVHSPAAFRGHMGKDGVATRRTVHPGDRAVWTPEGRLRLVGRTADILNVGGRKIPVATVEGALRAVAGIREVAVIGVDDPVRGDRIVAFVVSDDEELDLGTVPNHLAPREVYRLEALPANERGKLDRARLRALAGRDR